MHKSRLAGFILDCHVGFDEKENNVERAAGFWSAALGMPTFDYDGEAYVRLDGAARDLTIEVQSVAHDSRVHLDIKTDDIEAEVRWLERIGARRVAQTKHPDVPGFSTWNDEG